ncbi:Calcineurin-like phosphoesterase domain, ApaH type [uncultured Caudovirales phage]|uniref:Calcineurin-like phosphoesterase domain, ApaH type n=1 Tax=uncultured Caudovirales phage TaxID=2100421 RepID=A0A6J5LJ32_9CAUD|nr:Calcineurin-like phosphoesterase domain, ApaH type [uncultured Caudovirales phage]
MKIAICSDTHLEFGDLDLTNDENADVLILSGDILVAEDFKNFNEIDHIIMSATPSMLERGKRYYEFLKKCSERFTQVILIMGNHEHYHGDFAKTANTIRGVVGDLHNIHFLDKEWVIINGVLFFGGTLWTNMNNEDGKTLRTIAYTMNDYRGVLNSNKTVSFRVPNLTEDTPDAFSFKERPASFTPEDSVEDHKDFLKKLDEVLTLHPEMRTVVVGHHAPSKASTHPRYKKEFIMNGAYSTNLDDFILDRRQIKLWTHGHTHEDFDYMIGTCRVVCNPRGYIGYEDRADSFKLKYVEV